MFQWTCSIPTRLAQAHQGLPRSAVTSTPTLGASVDRLTVPGSSTLMTVIATGIEYSARPAVASTFILYTLSVFSSVGSLTETRGLPEDILLTPRKSRP